ncbi:MAG: OmpA family protein [Dermatophilus congolensis]|nr:OmpA family protein [Dermatophilus congolensis]
MSVVAALTVTLLAVGAAGPGIVPADWTDALPTPTPEQISSSVKDMDPKVRDIKLRVRDVASNRTDGSAKVVDLATDLLFEFGKADVRPAANAKLTQLLKPIPQRAKVSVHGHTDSIGTDADNLALSKARAEAVAAIIRTARPDLVLDVQGFGETKPLAAEGGTDDTDVRAKNRRVEIRYGG